jgi:hypothetical protein
MNAITKAKREFLALHRVPGLLHFERDGHRVIVVYEGHGCGVGDTPLEALQNAIEQTKRAQEWMKTRVS